MLQSRRADQHPGVEIVEVFSYGCSHCADLAPVVDRLRKDLPKAHFVFVPAVFHDSWEPMARAFYAARALGVLEKTHDALLKAVAEGNQSARSLEDLAHFYARYGVDLSEFLRIARSAEVTRELHAGNRLVREWGIDHTPTLVIDGRYRSADVKSPSELGQLAEWLVRRSAGSNMAPK